MFVRTLPLDLEKKKIIDTILKKGSEMLEQSSDEEDEFEEKVFKNDDYNDKDANIKLLSYRKSKTNYINMRKKRYIVKNLQYFDK